MDENLTKTQTVTEGLKKFSSLFFLFSASVIFLVGFVTFVEWYEKYQKDMTSLKWYQDNYKRQQGGNTNIPSYELLSFDGGQIWYAVSRTEKGAVKIIGLAENIYPGLAEENKGLDNLFNYIDKYGPVNVSDPSHIKLLNSAGFTVTINN